MCDGHIAVTRFKTAHEMHDEIHAEHCAQELIAEATALRRTSDQPRNVVHLLQVRSINGPALDLSLTMLGGVVRCGRISSLSARARRSGTATTPMLGLMVVKG